jgi:hypothetical protein
MILKLKNVRIAFCQDLHVPGDFQGDKKFSFSSDFILEAGDPQIKMVEEAIETLAKKEWPDTYKTLLPTLKANNKVFLRSGSSKTDANGVVYDGFEGNMYIAARNNTDETPVNGVYKKQPLVLDEDRSKLSVVDGKPYAGCYVNVHLEPYAYTKYGGGVSASMRGVQFAKDGEPFMGSAPVDADEFDDLSDVGDGAELI